MEDLGVLGCFDVAEEEVADVWAIGAEDDLDVFGESYFVFLGGFLEWGLGYCQGVGLGVDGADHESYNKIKLSKGGKIYIFLSFYLSPINKY